MKSFRFDEFMVDPASHRLSRQNGEAVPLTPRVFDLLLAFLESGGRVLTKDELLQTVWVDCIVEESNLSQSIFVLRKALGESAQHPRFIRTIPHLGYRFIAPVKIEEANGFKANAAIERGFPTKLSEPGIQASSGEEQMLEPVVPALAAVSNSNRMTNWRVLLGLAVSLAILSTIFSWSYFVTPAKPIESVAVLPFTNSTGDANSDYLSDGLTENITNKLARLQRLKVTARSVVSKYKSKEVDPRQTGKDLGVGAVLIGNVHADGERLFIRVELVEATSGNLLWGESYKRHYTDLLGLSEEIAGRTTEKLGIEVSADDASRLRHLYTSNAEAYSLYLQGRYFWRKQTVADIEKAIDFYNQALKIDPGYALAYAGIADCYNMMYSYDYASPAETGLKARDAALKAIEIDQHLAEGHLAIAWTRLTNDWDWIGSEMAFKKAIQLYPGNAQAHFWYSILLTGLGRLDEALFEIRFAHDLDPIYIERGLGTMMYFLRRYDEAIEHFNRSLEANPNNVNARWWLWKVYCAKGDKAKAFIELQKAVTVANQPGSTNHIGGTNLANTRMDFSRDHDTALRSRINVLIEEYETRYVSAKAIASYLAVLGENEKAIFWLQKALRDHSAGMEWIAVDPIFDNLRPDPRFQEILRKMNLENIKIHRPS